MGKTFARRALAALLTVLLTVSLVPAAFADDPPKITVTINGAGSSALPVGSTRQLTAAVTVDGAAQTNPAITWSSDRPEVAAVDQGGLVTAKEAGDAVITATYDYNSGTATATGKTTCSVKVVAASVTDLTLKIDGTTPLETSVGGSAAAKVDVAPKWSNTAPGAAERPFTDGEKKKLKWSAEIVSGGEFISLPYTSGTGLHSVRVDGVKATGTGEKATVKVTVSYKNSGSGVTDPEETITFDVTVASSSQVIITEYSVETREVTLIKGGSSKTLRAYVVKDGQWTDDDGITWTLEKTDIVSITPTSGREIKVSALAEGEVKLTATHTSGAESTVTCVVRTESSGGNNPGGGDPDTPPEGDTLPDGVKAQVEIASPTAEKDGVHTAEPGTENIRLSVTFQKGSEPASEGTFEWSSSSGGFAVYTDGGKRYEIPITWKSSNEKAVKVNTVVSGDSGRYVLEANEPGKSELTVSVAGATDTLTVEVKGFSLKADKFELYENGSMELKEAVVPYGGADAGELTCWSADSTVAAYVNGKIEAYKPGVTTFTVSDPNRGFRASFEVTVKADPNATIDYGTLHAQSQKFLSLGDLLSSFRRQAGGALSHITGINLSSAGGDLYYKYNATTGSGAGVGAENYYHPYRAGGIPYGGRSLEDLTFVPKAGYAGQVTIHYTGVSEDGKNYVCQLLVTVDPESGESAGISLTTPYNTALRLSGDDFNRVCRERLGVKLDHIVFSQPPERQGSLYTDYVGPGNYGRVLPANTKVSLKQVDDIWFVPAPGFSGTVTLYYTAYGTGTNAGSFAGQATIRVGQEDGVSIGGLSFDTVRGSAVRFDDERFNDYCRQVLEEESWYDRQTLSRIRFDALPTDGEGTLYYDYRSSANPGAAVEVGTSYYYGSRNPRIDRLTFAPSASFVGTVRLPFTGWTTDGTSFTGNVEVNVRGGSGQGDILYVCQPGKTVSFRSSDFTNLSRDLTGRTLNYIILRGLPAASDGSLYYNNSRISTTGARYQNSNLGRLSFRASNSFSGAVDIPFEGWSASGEAFSGVVTVSTSSSGSSGGSTTRPTIRYTARDGGAALFDQYDFDSLSQWETDRSVSSVRFQVPASTWGSLYRNYRSSSSQGTRLTSATSVSRSGLDQVAFVPSGSYSGTVSIDFTATATDGSTFGGTVEITVERGGWNLPDPAPVNFTDVPSTAYYAEPVRWAVENGITSGTSNTTFSPGRTCTVGQILSFLYRANGSPRVTGSNPFTDVRTSDYYYEAALWASQKGLVSGSTFGPNRACTRSMVVTYLWRLDGQPSPVSTRTSFTDVSPNASYARAVAWAVEQKITSGTSKTTFSPDKTCTRGQIVSFLYRAMGW